MRSSFRHYARPARWGAFAVGLAALLAVLCRSVAWNPVFCDYSLWIRQARDMAAGQTLYVDSYDIKQPPLILFVKMLDWGNPRLWVYVGHVVLGTLAGLSLYLALAATRGVRAPWLAPGLVACWAVCSEPWTRGWCSEAFAIDFAVMTVALLFLAALRGRAALAFAAGACYFMVFGLRVPCLLDGAAYLPIAWLAWRERGRATTFKLLAAFVGGLGLMIGLSCWHAIANGYWTEWWRVYERDKAYASLENVTLAQSLGSFARHIAGFVASRDLPAFALAAAGGGLLARHWRRLSRPARAWAVVALCWLATAVASVFPGGRHFTHYYEVLWPPLLVLGGLWPTVFRGGRAAARLGRRLAWGVLMGSVAVCLAERAVTYRNYRARMADGTHAELVLRKMQQEIEARVPPGDAMIDWVWGDWAELLWRARRPSGGRLPDLNVGLRVGMHPDVVDADVRRLLADTPRWVLLDDEFEKRTDWHSTPDVEALKARVRAQYAVAATAGPLRLLRRR